VEGVGFNKILVACTSVKLPNERTSRGQARSDYDPMVLTAWVRSCYLDAPDVVHEKQSIIYDHRELSALLYELRGFEMLTFACNMNAALCAILDDRNRKGGCADKALVIECGYVVEVRPSDVWRCHT
jgi:hypothetical protein